jgi:hypothetical protein
MIAILPSASGFSTASRVTSSVFPFGEIPLALTEVWRATLISFAPWVATETVYPSLVSWPFEFGDHPAAVGGERERDEPVDQRS